MADTKKLPRQERVAKKRSARRALREKWAALTRKERQEFAKAEKPLTVWLRERAAKADQVVAKAGS
ncbi:MAG: hypothetical protein QME96_03265 [Myxococcota bacterium]|nr:hypothetical protein [Myxococcota bacterium]